MSPVRNAAIVLSNPIAWLIALTATSAVAAPDSLPSRKPGLWEVSIQSKGQPEVKSRQCIDAKTDAQMQAAGHGMMQANCSKNTTRREGSGWVSESVCQLGKTTISSQSVISGDFDREIRMVVNSRYTPPLMGEASDQTTVTQRHAGACPAGWVPGEMEMPGMPQRINITKMPGAGGKR